MGDPVVHFEINGPDGGSLAKIADPEGNVIGIIAQGDDELPPRTKGDGREVGWWEILGTNPAGLRDFYTELLGWKVQHTMTEGFEYHTMDTDAGGGGINGGIGSSPDGQPHVNVYAGVDDLQKYCEIAESLGAKVVMPPSKVAESTEIALFLDPQG